MKYIDEFRDSRLAKGLSDAIGREVERQRNYRFMEFCGGHTHAIFRYAISDLLPGNVQLIHGPGCPVCVLPIARLDQAVYLAGLEGVILCTYGDMMRVPGSHKQSLLKASARGADVRMVYSTHDALRIAHDYPDKRVIFFAIGFETTTPPTAVAIQQADKLSLDNFYVFCNHILTPPALHSLLDTPQGQKTEQVTVDGFIGPAHVSTVIGTRPYDFVATQHQKPLVIAGFEPLDILQALLMLIVQVNQDKAEVENEYTRAVTPDGNIKAQAIMDEVFRVRDTFEWRGLGWVANSGLAIKPRYAKYDAEVQFATPESVALDNKACECPSVLRGAIKPSDCKIFATVCTPENPMGACMVSSEGACAAYYRYGASRNKTASTSLANSSVIRGA